MLGIDSLAATAALVDEEVVLFVPGFLELRLDLDLDLQMLQRTVRGVKDPLAAPFSFDPLAWQEMDGVGETVLP